jgi:superfamily II DNA helicase RecQ
LNEDTLRAARLKGDDLWARAKTASILLLGPEMLSGQGFSTLLGTTAGFWERVFLLVIDELHLLDEWGPGFRQAFLQIASMWARFPPGTPIMGLTATLLAGAPTDRILKFIGLEHRDYELIRRSNIRANIRVVFRELSLGLGGKSFPDLRWLLYHNKKTIVFCRTINLSFRVLVYLWDLMPGTVEEKAVRMRMYNAACDDSYNNQTRELMHNDPKAQIVLATDSLSVGVDFRLVWYTIVLGEHVTASMFYQDVGRGGRDASRVPEAVGLLYYSSGARDKARALLDLGKHKRTDGVHAKAKAEMDLAMARLLLSSCQRDEQNLLYDNPTFEDPCDCDTCSSRSLTSSMLCNCGDCMPWEPPSDPNPPQAATPPPELPVTTRKPPKMAPREKEKVRERLDALRATLFLAAPSFIQQFRPRTTVLPLKLAEQVVR